MPYGISLKINSDIFNIFYKSLHRLKFSLLILYYFINESVEEGA